MFPKHSEKNTEISQPLKKSLRNHFPRKAVDEISDCLFSPISAINVTLLRPLPYFVTSW